MAYVLNLTTKELSPLPAVQGADAESLVSSHAIVVSAEQAQQIGRASMADRKRIITRLLGERLVRDGGLPETHRKILSAGMAALGVGEVQELGCNTADEAVEVSEPAPELEPVAMSLDTGSAMALMTREQLIKMKSQSRLVKYAREMLGLEVDDHESFDLLKRRVMAMQFGETA